jgi:UDP-GlcNAc:undecaprenyl-phosphate GlcNAc-1-phosphate transferase
MRTYIFMLLLSAVSSYGLTAWVSRLAAEHGWARRQGDGPEGAGTPRLGGVAVYLSIVCILVFLLLRGNQVTDRVVLESVRGLALLGATAAVFLLGLYDDLRGARPWQKLSVQLLAAVGLFAAGFRVEILSSPFTPQPFELGWLALPVTVLWLVSVSNAFNLIDGLDGLAAGVGLFASVSLFLLALFVGNVFTAAMSAMLAGALLGFLPHNFPPARIYLGDSGSLTIGLILASLAIFSSQKGPVLITVAIPLLIFGLPLLEVSVTTLRRLLSGHPLFRRDEEHLHHRLVKIGMAKQFAVLVLYGLAALFALSSMLLFNYTGAFAPVIALLCGVLAWLVIRQMQYPEFAELDAHVRLAVRSQPQVLRNQILIRKASSAFSGAVTRAELWASLEALLQQLEFSSAECELAARNTAGAPQWSWSCAAAKAVGAETPAAHWTMEIPLVFEGRWAGVLRLLRKLDQQTLLFRLSSLLELITGPFCARLAALAQAQPAGQVTEADVPGLATARAATATARR